MPHIPGRLPGYAQGTLVVLRSLAHMLGCHYKHRLRAIISGDSGADGKDSKYHRCAARNVLCFTGVTGGGKACLTQTLALLTQRPQSIHLCGDVELPRNLPQHNSCVPAFLFHPFLTDYDTVCHDLMY